MEFIIIIYSIFFVFIPAGIAGNRGQSGWAILLNLLVSILVTPYLFLSVIVGAAFGSLDGLGPALICLFIPYSLAFIIKKGGGKELEMVNEAKKLLKPEINKYLSEHTNLNEVIGNLYESDIKSSSGNNYYIQLFLTNHPRNINALILKGFVSTETEQALYQYEEEIQLNA